MREIRLELPLPPSDNRQYARSKSGGVFLKPAIKAFRQEVWAAIKQAGIKTIYGPCRIHATYHPWRAGTFDAANRNKTLLDALEIGGLVENDRQFTDVHAVLGEVKRPHGGCVIRVTEIS